MNDNFENLANPLANMAAQEQSMQVQNEAISRRSISDMARMAIIATEVFPPTSGFIRYGSLALAETYTTSPWVGAAVLGGTTFALEWASYRAGVGWIAENKFGAVVDTIREKIDGYRDRVKNYKEEVNTDHPKVKPGRLIPNVPAIPENPEPGAKMPLWVQGGVGIEFGTVVLLSTKQEVDRTRDLKVNKRDGRLTVALVSGVLAVQGAAISAGVGFIEKDAEIGFSALGVGVVLYGAYKYAKNRLAARKTDSQEQDNER